MAPGHSEQTWQPVQAPERYTTLDLLRGFSLFGVLLMNLLDFFRQSLFEHILNFHSHAGWMNHAIDLMVAEFLEFKAFSLFSLTFGIGVAVQAERAELRGVRVELFLLRRFLILLAFGLLHLVFVSNVDILTLYAVCGLLMIPLLRVPAAALALVGLAFIYLPDLIPHGPMLPPESVLRQHAANATRIYGRGGFGEILLFRWRETRELIAPLLIGSLQRTLGVMLLGMAVWRHGLVRDAQRQRFLLWTVCAAAGIVGLINTTAGVLRESSGEKVELPPLVQIFGSFVPLALAYAAGLLAWRPSPRPSLQCLTEPPICQWSSREGLLHVLEGD